MDRYFASRFASEAALSHFFFALSFQATVLKFVKFLEAEFPPEADVRGAQILKEDGVSKTSGAWLEALRNSG